MEFKSIQLTNKQGNACALSNICGYWLKASSVMDIKDAIEDAITPEGVCKRLNNMDLLKRPWLVDRDTSTYLRLKHTDKLGNIDYLIINK